jgi:hypothetical protein
VAAKLDFLINTKSSLSRKALMTNDKITATRETLINDTDTLKRDAGQIVEDDRHSERIIRTGG